MAVGDAYVFPGFLTPVLTLLFLQSHRLLFSHASAEVRGENTPERKVASTWDRTHNHQVMSPTRSPLSHPGGSCSKGLKRKRQNCEIALLIHSHTVTPFDAPGKQAFWKHCGKRRNCSSWAISPFPTVFSTGLDNFVPFSSNLKLSSANSFSLEESKICHLG